MNHNWRYQKYFDIFELSEFDLSEFNLMILYINSAGTKRRLRLTRGIRVIRVPHNDVQLHTVLIVIFTLRNIFWFATNTITYCLMLTGKMCENKLFHINVCSDC